MKGARRPDPLAYDPVARHQLIVKNVVQKRVGGDLRKYYRFRRDRWYGGIITADCAGCGLTCKFCWVRSQAILEGREKGIWLSPDQLVERLLDRCRKEKIYQIRISGGEPTLGKDHLFKVLSALQHKRIRFILETNGILIGADETYAQELALYPFVHVRVSLKGCNEEEFGLLTGADPKGFQLQLSALRNLVQAGVSVHPAVMHSFSRKESLDHLFNLIWKINPRMHSEVELEEVILYPHVAEKLRGANLKYFSAHIPHASSR
jgi:uncharacterized Fe-S cluster-containing radical SAM superfamily protein